MDKQALLCAPAFSCSDLVVWVSLQVLRRLDNIDESVRQFFLPAAKLVLESGDQRMPCAAPWPLCPALWRSPSLAGGPQQTLY